MHYEQNFLQSLLKLPTLEILRQQHCPECRGRLRISYVKTPGETASLEARCYECVYVDEMDEIAMPPAWSRGEDQMTIVTDAVESGL